MVGMPVESDAWHGQAPRCSCQNCSGRSVEVRARSGRASSVRTQGLLMALDHKVAQFLMAQMSNYLHCLSFIYRNFQVARDNCVFTVPIFTSSRSAICARVITPRSAGRKWHAAATKGKRGHSRRLPVLLAPARRVPLKAPGREIAAARWRCFRCHRGPPVFPEGSPAVFAMVPHQVDRDAQDPGFELAFAPEAGAFLVGAQKAFLGESVGSVRHPAPAGRSPGTRAAGAGA